MPNITISEPGKSPENHKFGTNQKVITIGRGSDNDITIDCESVSTRHCHIKKTDDGYVLNDDDSTNGIKQGGKKQDSIDLTDGAEIFIGDTPLTFHADKIAKGSGEEPEETPSGSGKTNAQRKWLIPVFLLGLLALAGVAYMPYWGEAGMAGTKAETNLGRWIAFLGELHPLFLHLPIGALMLVLVMEICRIVTFGKYQPRTTLALSFAAGMAVFAVAFGYCLYLTGEFTNDLAEEHKDDGIIFTLLVIATFLIKYLSDAYPLKKAIKPFYALAFVATIAALINASHLGGQITHGDPLDKWPKKIDGEDTAVVLDPVVYKNIVHPILEQKCISCHGEKKQKSGLRMDSYAALIEGGDEEEALVPGNLEESMMIAYLHLPLEDDLHMPPEGKTQLTPEEIQILEWWVKIGAPEEDLLSQVEVTPAIAKALDTLKTPEEIAREKAARETAERERAEAMRKKRQLLDSTLTKVNEKFPGSLKYISQEDTSLVFSAVSYRSQFKDEDLDVLTEGSGSVTELNLGATKITDEGAKKLATFPSIEVLKLSETAVTDASLPELAKLKNLRVLNLYGTAVSDAGVKALNGHPTLKKIYLWQTKVTPDAAKALEQSLLEKQKNEEGKIEGTSPEVILGS